VLRSFGGSSRNHGRSGGLWNKQLCNTHGSNPNGAAHETRIVFSFLFLIQELIPNTILPTIKETDPGNDIGGSDISQSRSGRFQPPRTTNFRRKGTPGSGQFVSEVQEETIKNRSGGQRHRFHLLGVGRGTKGGRVHGRYFSRPLLSGLQGIDASL